MRHVALFGLFDVLLSISLGAGAPADPAPAKADPKFPFVPAPGPHADPLPPPAAGDVVKWRAGEWLVIERADACDVLAFPPDVVTVDSETLGAGEKARIRGTFAGGGGKVETRVFKGPYLYHLNALKSATVYVVVIPRAGHKDAAAIPWQAFDVDAGVVPVPPVPPNPGPNPPAPANAMGKAGYVVVIEETGDLVRDRRLTFADADLNAYMTAQGHKFRIADQNARKSLADPTPPDDLVRFLSAAKGKGYPQLFLVNTKGEIVLQSDVPPGAGVGLLAKIKAAGG